jgi:lysylphosphatidylglycerol synthetase-like protein (DUF2156 family)
VLVAFEGVAAVVAGIGFTVGALAGHPDHRGVAVFLGLLLAAFGLGILVVARGVRRARRSARTPAFLVQFFALVLAWNQRSTLTVVAVLLAAFAVVTAGVLLRLPPEPVG